MKLIKALYANAHCSDATAGSYTTIQIYSVATKCLEFNTTTRGIPIST